MDTQRRETTMAKKQTSSRKLYGTVKGPYDQNSVKKWIGGKGVGYIFGLTGWGCGV